MGSGYAHLALRWRMCSDDDKLRIAKVIAETPIPVEGGGAFLSAPVLAVVTALDIATKHPEMIIQEIDRQQQGEKT